MKKLTAIGALFLLVACSPSEVKALQLDESTSGDMKASIHSVLVGDTRMSINEIEYKESSFICIMNDWGDGQMWCERTK